MGYKLHWNATRTAFSHIQDNLLPLKLLLVPFIAAHTVHRTAACWFLGQRSYAVPRRHCAHRICALTQIPAYWKTYSSCALRSVMNCRIPELATYFVFHFLLYDILRDSHFTTRRLNYCSHTRWMYKVQNLNRFIAHRSRLEILLASKQQRTLIDHAHHPPIQFVSICLSVLEIISWVNFIMICALWRSLVR